MTTFTASRWSQVENCESPRNWPSFCQVRTKMSCVTSSASWLPSIRRVRLAVEPLEGRPVPGGRQGHVVIHRTSGRGPGPNVAAQRHYRRDAHIVLRSRGPHPRSPRCGARRLTLLARAAGAPVTYKRLDGLSLSEG